MNLMAELFAALGLGVGIAALTTFTSRSERYPSLGIVSFFISALVLFGVFAWAKLPEVVEFWLGAVGVGVALFSLMGLKSARHFERRSGM